MPAAGILELETSILQILSVVGLNLRLESVVELIVGMWIACLWFLWILVRTSSANRPNKQSCYFG